MDNLYQICQQLGFSPKLCVEGGAAHITTSQLREFVKNGTECILFEASPRLFWCLEHGYNNDNGKNFMDTWPARPEPPYDNKGWKDLPNVKMYNVAIHDAEGEINVYERNASTFVEGSISPAVVNDNYKEDLRDATKVKCSTIDKYDNGKIDLLCADMEGCEWYMLKYLKSRPSLICLETHGNKYVNPFIKEIGEWMKKNKYEPIHQTQSDTLFLQTGTNTLRSAGKFGYRSIKYS